MSETEVVERDVLAVLTQHYVMDCSKKSVDYWTRAALLRKYLEDEGLSIRSLASSLGVSHKTVCGWLRWESITKEEYDELRRKGLSHVSIMRALRDKANQSMKPGDLYEVDLSIIECRAKVVSAINEGRFSQSTKDLVGQLSNELNRLLMHIERKKEVRE